MSSRKLTFPDDLVLIWDYLHDRAGANVSEQEIGGIWLSLGDELTKKLYLPDANDEKSREDAVSGFVDHLFSGRRPEHIKNVSFLAREMKKYLARTRNPVQYEMHQILNEALHSLMKDGVVKQDGEGAIRSSTRFALAALESPSVAEFRDYERHRDQVPSFSTQKRANDWAKTKMLAPSDAKVLVVKLLEAFGGWVSTQDLFRAMKNHIPEQLNVVPLVSGSGDDGESEELTPADKGAENYIYAFDTKQLWVIASGAADRIWKRVRKISDRTFCIYWLPKKYYGRNARQEDVGPAQTVSDQCRRIQAAIVEELADWNSYPAASRRERQAIEEGLKKIIVFLRECCTEKGYPANLYPDEA